MKSKKLILISLSAVLLYLVFPYIIYYACFVKDNMTAYIETGNDLLYENDIIVRSCENSGIYSEEDVSSALEIVKSKADRYFIGSDHYREYRTVRVEEIWHDPGLDEENENVQFIYIRAKCYCCSDSNWWFDHGYNDTGMFTLVRNKGDDGWEFQHFGRC